jgi:hypothetical protein
MYSYRGKAAGREADRSLPSGAEAKNAWSCITMPQQALLPSS